ncbi:hypothetical protein ABPG75_006638 [Micractinium tetrahymenae]
MATTAAAKAPPAHPPYLTMIVAAIKALKERTGSSAPAIAKYIGANYKVPAGFEKTLSQQLKRQAAGGKLVRVKASFKLSEELKKPAKAVKKPAAKKAAAKKTPGKKASEGEKAKKKPAAKKASAKKSEKAGKKAAKPAKPAGVKKVKAAAKPAKKASKPAAKPAKAKPAKKTPAKKAPAKKAAKPAKK